MLFNKLCTEAWGQDPNTVEIWGQSGANQSVIYISKEKYNAILKECEIGFNKKKKKFKNLKKGIEFSDSVKGFFYFLKNAMNPQTTGDRDTLKYNGEYPGFTGVMREGYGILVFARPTGGMFSSSIEIFHVDGCFYDPDSRQFVVHELHSLDRLFKKIK